MISPQQGAQTSFLSTPADIAIYGGAAGGGKSWAILVEPLRHINNPKFNAIIFRRTSVQIRNGGGLWQKSQELYPMFGAVSRELELLWKFPSGATIKFMHMEHEKNRLDHQGAEYPLIEFDELTHFTYDQFFYLFSRNRTTIGMAPYIRATTNPDADSWVRQFIDWWIDPETGFAIPERGGKLRYMARVNNTIHWADTKQQLMEECGTSDILPRSVTFIPSSLRDNQILMKADPGYLASLMALPLVERERLLNGNWNIKEAAGLYFRRAWCEVVDAAPANLSIVVRYWDLAATEKTDTNDPDWTVGWKMGFDKETGFLYVLDVQRMRVSPYKVKQAIVNMAKQDGKRVHVGKPQDPGQAGKAQAQDMTSMLSGFMVHTQRETGDKVTRFSPFSAQCEAHNVKFVRGSWNEDVFRSLENFPEALHDDDADAASGAFNLILKLRQGVVKIVDKPKGL